MGDADRLERVRREPPPLLPVSVVDRTALSPRLLRITFEGEGARRLAVEQPAASVRLLVPTPGTGRLVVPEWSGNEFLFLDGTRPVLRTFTPLRVDNDAGRLDIEIVRHPGGAVSGWAEAVAAGAPAAISGPGSGYRFPHSAKRLLVLGDETAFPAISQLVDVAPMELALDIHVEVVSEVAIVDLAVRESDTIEWHVTAPGEAAGGRLADVSRAVGRLEHDTDVWAAGEASAMQAIRSHLFGTLGLERSRATVRGYWKPAR